VMLSLFITGLPATRSVPLRVGRAPPASFPPPSACRPSVNGETLTTVGALYDGPGSQLALGNSTDAGRPLVIHILTKIEAQEPSLGHHLIWDSPSFECTGDSTVFHTLSFSTWR